MAWGNNKGISEGLLPAFMRNTLGPLLLMMITPFVSIFLTKFVTSTDVTAVDSFYNSAIDLKDRGLYEVVTRDAFDVGAWKILGIFMAVQLILMRVVPGKKFLGPISPMDNIPIYKDNGFLCFLISMALFFAGVWAGFYPGGIVFYKFNQLVSSMNLFAFAFCGILCIKGLTFPSSTDSGSSGNIVMDFYWGTELYPRILGWDIKVFTNCRFGLMVWPISCLSFAFAQYELHGEVTNAMYVSVGVQMFYLAKFFWWETGYFKTIDIMHDRAGYYICWGCLVWVGTLYTAHTSFLVNHTDDISDPVAIGVFVAGILSVVCNYWVDSQRTYFRKMDGKCNIGGKPAEFIVAKYKTDDGKEHESKLLVSGWWGVSRHINYVFEMMAAYLWSVPFVHPSFLVPNMYWFFLLVLLTDRAYRDDARCRAKYGKAWDKYVERVPSLFIPGVW